MGRTEDIIDLINGYNYHLKKYNEYDKLAREELQRAEVLERVIDNFQLSDAEMERFGWK